MTDTVASSDRTRFDAELDWLRRMLEIREFEDAVRVLFSDGLVRGGTHLCQGQEAVAVGVASVLRPGDTVTCTYRGHGTVLAMGAPLDRCFGEILGRDRGICGGKGGSMHLTDVSVGALGSFAIVGAHLPLTAGAAWAAQLLGTQAVSVCHFGDGATNIGAFHETLNLAGVWRLPAVYVIENNLYGEYSPIAATTANPVLADRAAGYGMPGIRVDGNDLVAVREVAGEAVERARAGDGPTLVEALTYRHGGHSRADPATYRPADELTEWLSRDPIVLFRNRLLEAGVAQAALDEVAADARATVQAARDRAVSWPEPELSTRFTNVWSHA